MLKFRARLTPAEEAIWIYSDAIGSLSMFFALIEQGQLDPDTISRWTGLNDDNRVDIYEGDTIIFDDTDIGGEIVEGEVIFNTDPCLGEMAWGLWTPTGYMRTAFLGSMKVKNI
jgi:hypothetical protein